MQFDLSLGHTEIVTSVHDHHRSPQAIPGNTGHVYFLPRIQRRTERNAMTKKNKVSPITKEVSNTTRSVIRPGSAILEELRRMIHSGKHNQQIYAMLLLREVKQLREWQQKLLFVPAETNSINFGKIHEVVSLVLLLLRRQVYQLFRKLAHLSSQYYW